jgi:hypothetical protein
MSDCDIKAILSPDSPGISGTIDPRQTLTLKQDTAECCAIDLLNDVDISVSSGNGTVLVYDNQYDIYVRNYLDADFITDLDAFIKNYLATGNTDITFGANVNISGTLSVDGDIILKGSTINLGDGGDVININATVNNHFISTTTNTFDLGSSSTYWRNLYVQNIDASNNVDITNNLTVGGDTFFSGDVFTIGIDRSQVINFKATVNNHIYPTTTNIYNLGSSSNRWGTFYGVDVDLTGDLRVAGEIVLRGDTLTLGDGGDVINIGATVNSHLISTTDSLFDLGSTLVRWRNVYADYYYGDGTNLTISKSQDEDTPAALANGQLHYSFSSDKLYIGQTDTSTSTPTVEYIGGRLLVNKVANLESILAGGGDITVANAIVTGQITASNVETEILKFSSGYYDGNGVMWANLSGVVNFTTGSSGEVLQINDSGTPVFDDINGGTY